MTKNHNCIVAMLMPVIRHVGEALCGGQVGEVNTVVPVTA